MSIVYTIGYEGTDIDAFIEVLKKAEITTLADVRAVAISRKKGFSKSALKERLTSEGIKYLQFSELGDPKPGRDAARAGKYKLFQKIYMQHIMKDSSQSSLSALAETVKSGTTCLLCFERDPENCHRSIVARELEKFRIGTKALFAEQIKKNVRNHKTQQGRRSNQSIAAA